MTGENKMFRIYDKDLEKYIEFSDIKEVYNYIYNYLNTYSEMVRDLLRMFTHEELIGKYIDFKDEDTIRYLHENTVSKSVDKKMSNIDEKIIYTKSLEISYKIKHYSFVFQVDEYIRKIKGK